MMLAFSEHSHSPEYYNSGIHVKIQVCPASRCLITNGKTIRQWTALPTGTEMRCFAQHDCVNEEMLAEKLAVCVNQITTVRGRGFKCSIIEIFVGVNLGLSH
jgi:hypothetical protein